MRSIQAFRELSGGPSHGRGQAGCAERFIIDLVVLARCVNTGSRF